MNLKAFVETLSIKEREELLDILNKDTATWTTMPPHIKEELDSSTSVSSDFQVKKQNNLNKKRKEAVQAHGNIWSDTGEDRHIETPEVSRTPRNRAKPKMKSVTCHVCGKKSKVRASLVYGEYYRCDSCIG
jgi:hypothetical protein